MVYHLFLYAPESVDDDFESLFSLENEQTPKTLLVLDYSNSDQEEKSISIDLCCETRLRKCTCSTVCLLRYHQFDTYRGKTKALEH